MLRANLLVIAFFFTVVLALPALAAEPSPSVVSCECEQSACGACEVETGTTFYSAKCGVNESKVKSCKKPTCTAVENQKQCLAELAAKSGEKVAQETPAVSAPAPDVSRAPASEKPAGEVIQMEGSAVIKHLRGNSESVRLKMPVFEGDQIETRADGKVKVRLHDGPDDSSSTELIAVANTRVRVELAKFKPEKNVRQVTLNLLNGKLRSRVHQKYDTPENTYVVRTRSAVAGVRGTDFVASFEPGPEEWRSEIRTLEGKVNLSGGRGEAGAKQVDVPAGTYASFVITAPPPAADETEIVALIASGSMGSLYKMTDDESKSLDDMTEFRAPQGAKSKDGDRAVASTGGADGVCAEPHGEFNQCSWTCEGNPPGEKKCRTDLTNVKCVRRLCRANGQWAEPKRLPASQTDYCQPDKPVVRACGSYW